MINGLEERMEKNLLKEIKELLSIVETFKQELSQVSAKKEGFNAVNKHIETAISESEEATKKLIENIGNSLEELRELKETVSECPDFESLKEKLESLESKLVDSLTLLEFQDILAQRLLKIKGFISDIEKSILKILLMAGIEEGPEEEKEELKKKVEELEWKKEVSQDDVDEILKQFGL